MLIILEGCDGSGKSTLANNLASALNAQIIHCSTHTKNDYPFFKTIIDASKTQNIIADRFMYGQFVYQTAQERAERFWLDDEDLSQLEADLLEAGARVVFVHAGTKEIENRLRLRGETLINGLTVKQVQDRFYNLFKGSLLEVTPWNTSKDID